MYSPFKMKMKGYGQGKNPIQMKSPAKAMGKPKKMKEGDDTKNELGQSQADVMKMRKKNIKTSEKNVKKGNKQLQKSVNKGMSMETAKQKQDELRKQYEKSVDAFNFSADSINQVNPGILAERKRQAEIDAEQKYDNKQKKRG